MADELPLRERILKASGKLFFNEGFHRITLLEVVSRARTSKSSIYKFFRSKEHLVATLIEQLHEIVSHQMESIVQEQQSGFEHKLHQISQLHFRLSGLVSLQFEEDLRNHLPDLWARYCTLRSERIQQYLRPLFRQGLREEVLRRDVGVDLLLILYLKHIELACRPQPEDGLALNAKVLRQSVNTLFLEGALEP